jgi:hypothetical protein
MKKVYDIKAQGCYSQRHCVVAETMEDAARIWRARYKSDPDWIEIHSEYVLIQEDPLPPIIICDTREAQP